MSSNNHHYTLTTFKRISWIIILLALLTWIGIFVLRFNHIPTVGDIYLIAPWTVFLGLHLLVVKAFRSGNKRCKEENKPKFGGVIYKEMIPQFILSFWSFCGIFVMLIVTLMSIALKSSEPYKFITKYIENEPFIEFEIGKVYAYGTLVNGTFSSENANIHLKIYAEKANPKIQNKL